MNSSDQEMIITFKVDDQDLALNVIRVQEVVAIESFTKVPLAPNFIKGLVNLRGQLSIAMDLKELLFAEGSNNHLRNASDDVKNSAPDSNSKYMSIVCQFDDHLVTLIIDKIGDVIEVSGKQFETMPLTVGQMVSKYIVGVYKTKDGLLSVLNLDAISKELSKELSSVDPSKYVSNESNSYES